MKTNNRDLGFERYLYARFELQHLTIAWLGIISFPVWSIFDYFLLPQHFRPFLQLRLAVAAVCLIMLLCNRIEKIKSPVNVGNYLLLGATLFQSSISVMIHWSGDKVGFYLAGLALTICISSTIIIPIRFHILSLLTTMSVLLVFMLGFSDSPAMEHVVPTLLLLSTIYAFSFMQIKYKIHSYYQDFRLFSSSGGDILNTTKSQITHMVNQMSKVWYPHQIHAMLQGDILENTMPQQGKPACVIAFDIVDSTNIELTSAKEFFRRVFGRCYLLMNEGYDSKNMRARAYRIKEMGDGFLCSVGYPFEALNENLADEAMTLALQFAAILAHESSQSGLSKPVTCGIGIAKGYLTGFFPELGVKDYDLFGQGIVLAKRYEQMRKLFSERDGSKSVIIMQNQVFAELNDTHKKQFIKASLPEMGTRVRDDPEALALYYCFAGASAMGDMM